ncbi:natural product precursor [Spirosomataceae bacterium TFI 002]|nr:natural product precursor [Spirosomataceae bacterium TFI 002]
MQKTLADFQQNQLSKNEMSELKGGYISEGGTCNAKCSATNNGVYEWSRANNTLSRDQAISNAASCNAAGGQGYWCCASCP